MLKAFSRSTPALVTLVILAASLGIQSAEAAVITYTFTVTATSGPLKLTQSTGSYSFDDGIIPAPLPAGGAVVSGAGLLTDLAFAWNGISYDETSANTGSFGFHWSSSGPITYSLDFGNKCNASGCGVGAMSDDWSLVLNDDGIGSFTYSTSSYAYVANGLVKDGRAGAGVTPSVPLPSSMVLLVTGLALLAGNMRRKPVN